MSDNKYEPKKMCGLWHAHVEISQHNNNGTCPCLSCGGIGVLCHKCKTRQDLAQEIWDYKEQTQDFFAKTRCELCQGYDKTK